MPQTLRTGGRENADLPAACNPERLINFVRGTVRCLFLAGFLRIRGSRSEDIRILTNSAT